MSFQSAADPSLTLEKLNVQRISKQQRISILQSGEKSRKAIRNFIREEFPAYYEHYETCTWKD